MRKKIDVIALFSGGLDSLLAARLLQDLGLNVLCLHFTSPFFGSAARVPHWNRTYGLRVRTVDATAPFVKMLAGWPPNGIGKTLNPCVDCKIVLLRMAKAILAETGAKFIATGEVLGQRPMSQRSDTLNIIARDSGTKELLLRPLCAQLLPPTPMEAAGIVDRDRLLRISGRGRNGQLTLAEKMGITEIPNPGGGCRLTERENARRYWPLLRPWLNEPCSGDLTVLARDLRVANRGRMHLRRQGGHFCVIGRNERDNGKIAELCEDADAILRLPFPGPLCLARGAASWPAQILAEAAAILASYAPPGRRVAGALKIRVIFADGEREIAAIPDRMAADWELPSWEEAHEEIKLCRKERMEMRERK